MERIQTNPVHMSLDGGREFMADVYNFGFVALYTVSEANVLTLCSPSGHVIVYKTGPSLQLALEVRDILFKITDVKKVTFYKAATEKSRLAHSSSSNVNLGVTSSPKERSI